MTGTAQEYQYELQTYGIPTQMLPFDSTGAEILFELHRQWLQKQRYQETSSKEYIMVPRRFDVLFGKGKTISEHTGNLRAAHLVEMYRQKYELANKFEKTEIAERIVGIIHESYGRFLKLEEGGWVEVDHDTARNKISHFFRRMRETTPASRESQTAEMPPSDASSRRRSSSSTGEAPRFPGKRSKF